jgi:acetyl esterase/lipase
MRGTSDPPSHLRQRSEERGHRPGFGRASVRPLRPQGGIGVRVFLDVPYCGKGGERHKLDLYLPAKRHFPVVLFAHGGSWIAGDKALYGHLGAFLARHGIGAVLANYRLAPQVSHPAAAEDLARAVAWTRRHTRAYGGDPDQLYLCGHSAGGHLVSLLGTDESFLAAEGLGFEQVRGVITISGVYKIHWNVTLAGLGFVFAGADRRAASPFSHVKAGCPPFLVMYARKEIWTLPGQACAFHQKLLEHNGRSRLVVADGVNHSTIIDNLSLPGAAHAGEVLKFIQEG